jgi:hypothetical protein
MTDLQIISWIRELDEQRAVGLARSLIHAEAGRLALPLTDFSMSGRVKARDEGVDGRTHFPIDSDALLPRGPFVWQVKSGTTPPSTAKEFNEKHDDLISSIRDGYNYVLFWTNDPADPTAETVRRDFQAAVQNVRADATTEIIFGDQISRLCFAHLAVLAQIPVIPLPGVISLRTWGAGQGFDIPYQADEARRSYMETLRNHVRGESARSSSLHLYGDTGVGKSRLVFEALTEENVEERVLVALDPALFDRSLLTLVAESQERRSILVVDDCTPEDRRSISQYADLAQGRVRLVTVGSRYNRDPQPLDARYLELGQLTVGASRQIALSAGLSDTDANLVAEYTEGYPNLPLSWPRLFIIRRERPV